MSSPGSSPPPPQGPPPSLKVTTTAINAPAWVMTGLAVSMVIARTISRTRLGEKGAFGWDDILIIVSMALCLLGVSLLSAAITAGLRVTPENFQQTIPIAFALNFASNTTFILSIPFSKFPAAVLLCRIFEPQRATRFIIFGGCAFIFILGIPEYLINWLSCNPPGAQWNPWKHPNAKCWNIEVSAGYGMALGCLSALQDFAMAAYPAFQLRKLQISTRMRIWLSGLLGLGFVAGIFAIVKVWELHLLLGEARNPGDLFDVSLHTVLWNIIENSTIIICACVPTVLPLFRWLAERSRQSMIGSLISRSFRSSRRAERSSGFLSGERISPSTSRSVSDRSVGKLSGTERILMERTIEQTYTSAV